MAKVTQLELSTRRIEVASGFSLAAGGTDLSWKSERMGATVADEERNFMNRVGSGPEKDRNQMGAESLSQQHDSDFFYFSPKVGIPT